LLSDRDVGQLKIVESVLQPVYFSFRGKSLPFLYNAPAGEKSPAGVCVFIFAGLKWEFIAIILEFTPSFW